MDFAESGHFFVGCNYWASHAGIAMWREWRADIVEADFNRIAGSGMRVLRVFPLWPDFQPITLLRQACGEPREYSFSDEPLPDDECGRAGMNPVMVERFAQMCALAEKYGLQLIVGLVTGWMSGRFFAPQPLEGLNTLTDPTALKWEIRMTRFMARRFRDEKSIVAWDLGNECNCMANLDNSDQAWLWTAAISNAIRSEDSARPIVSGMHSLSPDGNWRMRDQGELLDILTTHPYPLFTPHCDLDPLDTMRPALHATAESLYYAGLGEKPCFAEECGTLGPMFASEEVAAKYVNNLLYTLWSHDCRGFLWWCANDQKHLTRAPYDWNAVERELGLFRQNGEAKPVAGAIAAFSRFIEDFPYDKLPARVTDGVCLISRTRDPWGTAYISFTLAKQAGLDISFSGWEQPVPEAKLYFLPNLTGDSSLPLRRWKELLSRVEAGATLYLSGDTGLMCPFQEFTGLKPVSRSRVTGSEEFDFEGIKFSLKRDIRLKMECAGATALALDGDGLPAFTEYAYGRGRVYFMAFPLERNLFDMPGAFAPDAPDYASFYRRAAARVPGGKIAASNQRTVCVTEHPLSDSKRILVVINYEPASANASITLADGWRVSQTWGLEGEEIPANSARVMLAQRIL